MIKNIVQLLPTFSPRDAIGTEASLIRDFLRSKGHKSEIYCLDGHQTGVAKSAKTFLEDLEANPNSTVLFHLSVGSDLSKLWPKLPCHRWLRYHNITPMQFFTRSDELHARYMCGLGRIQLPQVVAASDLIFADSAFNAKELIRFTNRDVNIVPVFRDYDNLRACPTDIWLQEKLLDKSVSTVLFVGRVSPNKCQHDLLQLLALHKKVSPRKVRLIFAGSYFSASYKNIIHKFSQYLGLELATGWDFSADVLTLGSISDEQLATLYRYSDLFASMSEHEGFGVPIVESMYFDLPVFAHRATAVPEILGDGRFLVDKFDWAHAVKVFDKALFDEDSRRNELERAKFWRSRFDFKKSAQTFNAAVEKSLF